MINLLVYTNIYITIFFVNLNFTLEKNYNLQHLGQCGMYKNHSLNTSMDKSNVPEY